jgi:hypothetical protein
MITTETALSCSVAASVDEESCSNGPSPAGEVDAGRCMFCLVDVNSLSNVHEHRLPSSGASIQAKLVEWWTLRPFPHVCLGAEESKSCPFVQLETFSDLCICESCLKLVNGADQKEAIFFDAIQLLWNSWRASEIFARSIDSTRERVKREIDEEGVDTPSSLCDSCHVADEFTHPDIASGAASLVPTELGGSSVIELSAFEQNVGTDENVRFEIGELCNWFD